ncbi:hypothetical protein [uncultured Oscillibacter sp.]|uniref:hypothetical protein n=1 Tax=uncultured Oscillibacter sp. TaxID=876091 RepID=UPI002628E369|nr:hypothetical protein [uncultured Oscillibacter sp.]
MKLWKFGLALALCLSLTACGNIPAETSEDPAGTAPLTAGTPPAPADSTLSLDPDEEPTVLTCRIVDGAEDGTLLLAELDEGLHGGTGVYRLAVKDVPVTLDGEAAEPSALEDGMAVDVAFNGTVMETFPAQLGEVYSVSAWTRGRGRSPAGTTYDLCGLYLQVLDDLWEKDKGLNENITLAGLDLSQAPGELTESEKAALAWRFGELHGVEVVTGTFDELKEQGYFTASAISTPAPEEGEDYSRLWYQWEDGCLFSITPNEDHEGELYSLPAVFFNAEKWRSPLGAYFFHDCSAMWPEAGTWSGYQIGSEMIS